MRSREGPPPGEGTSREELRAAACVPSPGQSLPTPNIWHYSPSCSGLPGWVPWWLIEELCGLFPKLDSPYKKQAGEKTGQRACPSQTPAMGMPALLPFLPHHPHPHFKHYLPNF